MRLHHIVHKTSIPLPYLDFESTRLGDLRWLNGKRTRHSQGVPSVFCLSVQGSEGSTAECLVGPVTTIGFHSLMLISLFKPSCSADGKQLSNTSTTRCCIRRLLYALESSTKPPQLRSVMVDHGKKKRSTRCSHQRYPAGTFPDCL